ncbi:hypothetical protein [Saezia sanguinis]|uniref:hypothetical protein n=1 Tax=Saezia sanguinis TaxID=1965230 RepID=UPI003036A5B7
MIPDHFRNFVDQLHDATREGTVIWEEGANSNYFFCSRKIYNVHLTLDDINGVNIIELIFYVNGEIQQSFTVNDSELREEEDYLTMEQLHTLVHQKVNDISYELEDFFKD